MSDSIVQPESVVQTAIKPIGFVATQVKLTNTRETDLPDGEFELKTDLTTSIRSANDAKDRFAVCFDLDVTIVGVSDFRLEVSYLAEFITNSEITPEFLASKFVRMNAPAIAFPYLRAFVTNLTVSANCIPIILPARNFASKPTETPVKADQH